MSDSIVNTDTPLDLGSGSFLRRFFVGFSFPFRGLAFVVRTPALWPWVILPVLCMTALIVGAGLVAMWVVPQILGLLWAAPVGGWALFGWRVLAAVLWILVFVISTVMLYLCFGLIATPFYDQLSEQTEAILIGPRQEVSWRQWWGDIMQSVVHSLCAFVIWFCFFCFSLVLGFIPVVGQVLDFFIGGGLTAFLMAREMMDGPMSRRRFRFRTKLAVVWKNLALAEGFGVATTLFLAVPVLNLFSLPCAVVGGTRMFVELERQGLLPDSVLSKKDAVAEAPQLEATEDELVHAEE